MHEDETHDEMYQAATTRQWTPQPAVELALIG